MRGVMHEALEYPELPNVLRPILDVFNELNDTSFQELKAYSDMTGTKLDSFDIAILKDIEYAKQISLNGHSISKVMEAFQWHE